MEASIGQITRLTGTTSRTLRHYHSLGLVSPSRTATGGVRWYDEDGLLRLQRVLLLRDLGLPLARIADVLDTDTDEIAALREHLTWLDAESHRLSRQAQAVRRTLAAREKGTPMDIDTMFDGFDHTVYKEEVTTRWGKEAYEASDSWWTSLSDRARSDWKRNAAELGQAWVALAAAGADPAGPQAQELAERHVLWVSEIPGTPGTAQEPDSGYILGLGDMYVADPRFARNYGGQSGAEFVRSALRVWASA